MSIEIAPALAGTSAEELLREAIAHALSHDSKWDRAMGDRAGIHHLDPPPWNVPPGGGEKTGGKGLGEPGPIGIQKPASPASFSLK